MDLTHSFTVPASKADTWAAFEDIERVAGCFPGAVVTEVQGEDFKGTCKVKLGPIALTYSGSGTFVSKDEAAGRFVIEAKGKDKRGNGTAGATVTATLTEAGADATQVEVLTDLAITGKPAQFGRGVMQDVSDKLLQQFVSCLQDKVGSSEASSEPATDAATASASTSGSEPGPALDPDPDPPGGAESSAPSPSPSAGPGLRSAPPVSEPRQDDALDLGATVLPVLLRSYGKQAGAAVLLLLLGWLLGRRSR